MTNTLLMATAAVCWSMVAGPINAQVTEHRITIFHTNDLRGNLYAEDGLDDADPAGNQGPGNAVDRGGLAALVSMIRAHNGAGGDSTLVLDGGNAVGATPACDVDGCRTFFQLMDMAGYDAMVVGGHELTYGLDTLATRAGQADFPVLGANLEFGDAVEGNDDTVEGVSDTLDEVLSPLLLTERSDLQIAVMGLVSSRMADNLSSTDPAALNIQDPRETLESLLSGPAGRADVRIALVNMDMDEARDLALAFPQIQLFIAGGTATGPESPPAEHVVRFIDGRYLVTTPGRRHYDRFRTEPRSGTNEFVPASKRLDHSRFVRDNRSRGYGCRRTSPDARAAGSCSIGRRHRAHRDRARSL